MEIRTYKQLEKVIQDAAKKMVEDTGKEVAEITRKEIETTVYSKTPNEEYGYERTYELKNSMRDFPVEKKGNAYEVEIKHDLALMPTANPNKYQHASNRWNPVDYRPYVAQTVHDGLSGRLFGYGFWTQPRPYIDYTMKALNRDKSHVKAAKESLRKQGFKIE